MDSVLQQYGTNPVNANAGYTPEQTVSGYNPVVSQNMPVYQPAINSPATIPTASAYPGYTNTQTYNYPTYQQYSYPATPQPSVGAVSININNPSVYPANQTAQPAYNPYYVPYTPQNYVQPQPQYPQYQPQPQPAQPPQELAPPQHYDPPKHPDPPANQLTPLTPEYLQTLKNYLMNDNLSVKINAMQEILNRFKEDRTRADHEGLTELLNLGLKDKNQTIRATALQILGAGYANGNSDTINILKEMQNSKEAWGQDALEASTILLNKSNKNNTNNTPAQGH